MNEGQSPESTGPTTNLPAAMDVREQLDELQESIGDQLGQVSTLDELDALESETIGRRSALAAARRGLGKVDPGERRDLGRFINDVAQDVGGKIEAKRLEMEAAADTELLAHEFVDVTLPGRVPARGTHHLLTSTMEEMADIFVALGYTVATGPEVESAWYNFTALNIPPTHSARAETDTLYIDYGDGDEEVLLRTHTSPLQARYMENYDPPVYLVVPGRVYRRETTDATHSPVFHQMEGLAVDEGITFAHLKGTLAYFAEQFLGNDRKVRFLPNYFPFTEPSAEMHVDCFACEGSGCRVCGQSGWIELLGCGMVNPKVFEAVGYDPSQVTGWAFGMGVDRFAMARHGISDIRHLWDTDLRVLGQFT